MMVEKNDLSNEEVESGIYSKPCDTPIPIFLKNVMIPKTVIQEK